MSISSMTNIAVQQHAGVKVSTLRGLESAASAAPAPQSAATAALKAIASYIPSEVLTVYVGVIAAIQSDRKLADWALPAFWIFLILTPMIVWLVYGAKLRAGGQPLPWLPREWPIWEMVAAALAFAVWGCALPDNPFKSAGWYSPALAGIAVLVVSTALGLLAPVFKR